MLFNNGNKFITQICSFNIDLGVYIKVVQITNHYLLFWSFSRRYHTLAATNYLKLVNGYPRVVGELLDHCDQEHETSRPVSDQEHEADEVDNLGKNVGHVEELKI